MSEATDEAAVAGAQARAAISGYLAQNPGKHASRDIAAALNANPHQMGQYLRHMAREKLIGVGKRDGQTAYFHREGAGENHVVMADTKRGAKGRAAANAKRKAKDVELVINGTQIVVGRNAATGRIRITLEDL